jgi:hypothetical protein
MKTTNTTKLIEAMSNKDGELTELYKISKPKHYNAYVLSSISVHKNEDLGRDIIKYRITDIKGETLLVTYEGDRVEAFFKQYKLYTK